MLAVALPVSTPISIGLWFAIHPLARLWRRIGPVWTYTVLAVPSSLIVWLLWRTRDGWLGTDLGTEPPLLAVAIPSAVAGAAIARFRRRQLPSRILTGIPELSSEDTGRLVTEGIYARIRNPRCVEFLCVVLAYVGCANHAGTWVLYALAFPAIHAAVLPEERELADRFGTECRDYCRRVPRYVARRRLEPSGSRRVPLLHLRVPGRPASPRLPCSPAPSGRLGPGDLTAACASSRPVYEMCLVSQSSGESS